MIAAPGSAGAAAKIWSGGGDGTTWNDPANWAPFGTPQPADDLEISSSALITAGQTLFVTFNSLVLGDGISSPTLKVSTGIHSLGPITIKSSAALQADGMDWIFGSTVTVERGGRILHTGPVQSSTVAVRIEAAYFELRPGATVALEARGFAGGETGSIGFDGYGPGAGGRGSVGGAGGGGHGGAGGAGANLPTNGGVENDSKTDPALPGSGGGGAFGSCVGGAGGGVFHLKAATAVINGLIDGDGFPGAGGCIRGGGGGAGGTIRLETSALYGTGELSIRGGDGGPLGDAGGGGGGGRLLIRNGGFLSTAIAVSTNAGAGGTGPPPGNPGSPGTVIVDPKVWTGLGGPPCSDSANWLFNVAPQTGENVVFGSTSPAKDCFWVFNEAHLDSLTLESGYTGVLSWGTNISSVAGRFEIAGGTFTTNIELKIGGDFVHTGGYLGLSQGTITLTGTGARSVSVATGAFLYNLTVASGAAATLASDLDVNGILRVQDWGKIVLTPGTTLFASGALISKGSVTADASHLTLLDGNAPQIVDWGGFGILEAANPAGANFPSGLTVSVSSSLIVDAGAVLNAAQTMFQIAGDWVNAGTFSGAGSTVAFVNQGSTQAVLSGAQSFSHLLIATAAAGVRLSTSVVVADGVTIEGGLFDLGDETHRVRGHWTQTGGEVRESSSTVVFDGTVSQRIFSSTVPARFRTLVSSSSAQVVLGSSVAVSGDLVMRRGRLDFSTRSVAIGSDFLWLGSGAAQLSAAGSTLALNGSGLQTIALGPGPGAVDSLVVSNGGSGVRLGEALIVGRNFTVEPGAVFDGASSTLSMRGAGGVWTTAGADYRSDENGNHLVEWDPRPAGGGALSAAAGSTVNARVAVLGPVVLLGDLSLAGIGNELRVSTGATLDASGSTLTLRGTSDLRLDGPGVFLHDPGSWIVFRGTGSGRGASLSTGPIGGLRIASELASEQFVLSTVTLSGDLVVESGIFRLAPDSTLSLKGDLRGSGGLIDLSSGTLRLTGAARQELAPAAGDAFNALAVDSSSEVVIVSEAIEIGGGLALAAGELKAGTAAVSLRGDWTGTGGTFTAQTSTVVFANALATQTYSDSVLQTFHGLAVSSGYTSFASAFDAAVFTAERSSTTLAFVPGSMFTIGDFRINGVSTAAPAALRSAVPGSAFLMSVARSTVTAADVRDADMTAGATVYANDGFSVNRGNTPGWQFRPALLALAPGETFAEGTGRGGSPVSQTAGTPFVVTMRAVSNENFTVRSVTATVALATSDAFDVEPGTGSLLNGTTTLVVDLRTAEPNPAATLLTPSSPDLGETGTTTVAAVPAPFSRLQLLIPGESQLPGSESGKIGVSILQIQNRPFDLRVRGTDAYWNLVSGAADLVSLSAPSGAQASIPADRALSAGFAVFPAASFQSTGTFTLTADDQDDPSITAVESSTFPVFQISASSPALSFAIPAGATLGTLNGFLVGAASDEVAVAEVSAAIRDNSTGLFFDWGAQVFSLAGTASSAAFKTADMVPFRGQSVAWQVPLSDERLVDGTEYFVIIRSSNPSGLVTVIDSTFTYSNAGLFFGASAGEGSASVSPSSPVPGCAALVTTVTFTVGASGIGPGGAVALKVPDGWTTPAAQAADPPPLGYASIISTSSAWSVPGSTLVVFNPPSIGSVSLGKDWITIRILAGAPNSFKPGEEIRFVYKGFPPPGEAGLGPQFFDLMTESGAGGDLVEIGDVPSVHLTTAAARFLSFDDYRPLTVGPLQSSPTMQILVTDACGNPTTAPSALEISLSAGSFGPGGFEPDPAAEFFTAGLATRAATVEAGGSRSSPFAFRTSTAGVDFEFLVATAALPGGFAEASRFVELSSTAVALTAVSIDSGTLTPGATSVVLSPGTPGAEAVVRFSLNDPGLDWEVLVATGSTGTEIPLLRSYGHGDPVRAIRVPFSGVACEGTICRFLDPGVYGVRISAAGGSAVDSSLEIRIPATASIGGGLGLAGAGARVRVEGKGAGYGNFTRAGSTGSFRIYGLADGEAYNVFAETETFLSGRLLSLTTAAYGAVASQSGGTPLSLGFPVFGTIRGHFDLQINAPRDIWGSLSAGSADGSSRASGVVHISSGSSSSDDGARIFGRTASTFTSLSVPPGTYEVQVDLSGIGISSAIPGVQVAAGETVDVIRVFPRLANLYGFAALPSTKAAGSWVTIEGLPHGSTVPTVFGGTFIPPADILGGVVYSSGPYALFGLAPGTWTVTAAAAGFLPVSSRVFVTGSVDIGTAATALGGLDLRLGFGAVIRGTVTAAGDTRGLGGTGGPGGTALPADRFGVGVDAYDPATYALHTVFVNLPVSSTVASATFSITGLAPGEYRVRTGLPGFVEKSGGERTVAASTGTPPFAGFDFSPASARALLTVKIPERAAPCLCASDFSKIGMSFEGPGGALRAVGDITGLGGVDGAEVSYFPSSMTLLTPPLGAGFREFRLMHGPSGNFRAVTLPLFTDATAAALVDLSGATATVSGTLSLSGLAAVAVGDETVSVSSAAGLLAHSSTASFCLLSSTAPVTVTAAHVQLVPLKREGGREPAPLLRSSASACADYLVPSEPSGPPSLAAFVAVPSADGSFRFPGVPPGSYALRNYADLDGRPENGGETAEVSILVHVGGDAEANLEISGGASVAGRLVLPQGSQTNRPVSVSLADSAGRTVRSVRTNFNGRRTADFALTGVADGSYSLLVSDLGHPRAFAAQPRSIKVAGADLRGLSLELKLAGAIQGRIAVEILKPDGSREFIPVTAANRVLLPAGLEIAASANPWLQGGFFEADCPGEGCAGFGLDRDGLFRISGVLPGVYDVEFNVLNGEENSRRAARDLVPAVRAGVSAAAGAVSDIGTVRLRAAATLSGRVFDAATGEGIENAPVSARPSARVPGGESRRRPFPSARSGPGGLYRLRGLDPAVRFYDLTAAGRSGDSGGLRWVAYRPRTVPAVDLKSTATLDFSLLPAVYEISGRVAADDGSFLTSAGGEAPQAGALLYLQREGILPTENALADIVLRTEADGSFQIPALATGAYRLTATALEFAPLTRAVVLATGSISVGSLVLGRGGTLSGAILNPDGSAPGEDEVLKIAAATPANDELLLGTLVTDPNMRTIAGYRIGGFSPGKTYRVLLVTAEGELVAPAEGNSLVFESSVSARSLDLSFRRSKPFVLAKSRRAGGKFLVDFRTTHPLRSRTAGDDDGSLIVSTVSAAGTLSGFEMEADRRGAGVSYAPAVGESSFTLRLRAYSALKDPDSLDPVHPEFLLESTFTFFAGLDGYQRTSVLNLSGGSLAIEGDGGRVSLPKGAFFVDASSSVRVTFQKSDELLAGTGPLQASGLGPAEANLRSLRFGASAYPGELLRAMAATPPEVSPLSAFYDILLPSGVRSQLAKPVELTVTYSTAADPASLNLYWYNPAANAYILQRDPNGASPSIDAVNRTLTLRVDHFSTFVLFNTGVAAISGNAFGGERIEAFNFPNPFDLSVKTVTPIHGPPNQVVRGTMIRFAVPAAVSGAAKIDIFNVAGERVRTLDLGVLAGGRFYYEPWDGRNDSGRDVSSGVYVGQVKVGKESTFFKMGLIK